MCHYYLAAATDAFFLRKSDFTVLASWRPHVAAAQDSDTAGRVSDKAEDILASTRPQDALADSSFVSHR